MKLSTFILPLLILSNQLLLINATDRPAPEQISVFDGDETATLFCDVSSGFDDRFVIVAFTKNGIPIALYNSTFPRGNKYWYDKDSVGKRAGLHYSTGVMTLIFSPVIKQDEGEYECNVEFRVRESRTKQYNLIVRTKKHEEQLPLTNERPEFAYDLMWQNNQAKTGEDITLQCIAKKPLNYKVWWTKVSTPLYDLPIEDRARYIEGHQKGSRIWTLTIKQSRNYDGSFPYFCNIASTTGSKSYRINLDVRKLHYIPGCGGDETTCRNRRQCTYTRWFCDGEYDCHDRSDEFLCKTESPEVSIDGNDRITEGENMTLNCELEIKPPVYEVTWFFNGQELPVDLYEHNPWKLMLRSVNTSESGLYSCKVKNKISEQMSKEVNITIDREVISVVHVNDSTDKPMHWAVNMVLKTTRFISDAVNLLRPYLT